MSAEKQDGKVSAIFTLGAFVENQLEQYKKELLGLEGTRQALFVLAQKMEQYVPMIDRELEQGLITMKESATAKRHVAVCIGVVKELAKASETQLHQAEGKIAASDKYITDLKQMFDDERDELQRMKTWAEEEKRRAQEVEEKRQQEAQQEAERQAQVERDRLVAEEAERERLAMEEAIKDKLAEKARRHPRKLPKAPKH